MGKHLWTLELDCRPLPTFEIDTVSCELFLSMGHTERQENLSSLKIYWGTQIFWQSSDLNSKPHEDRAVVGLFSIGSLAHLLSQVMGY